MSKNKKILLYVASAVVALAIAAFVIYSSTGGNLFMGFSALDMQFSTSTTQPEVETSTTLPIKTDGTTSTSSFVMTDSPTLQLDKEEPSGSPLPGIEPGAVDVPSYYGEATDRL